MRQISRILPTVGKKLKAKGFKMTDFILMKSEKDDTGRLVELINNLHCEVYEVQIDGIPVFNCTDYEQAEHEYRMECV